MENFHVRPALPDDIDGIHAVYSIVEKLHREVHPEIFKEADNPDDIKEYLLASILSGDSIVFVAESDQEIIGIVIAQIRQTQNVSVLVQRTYLNISDLVVIESFRKQGVGKALMEQVYLWASERGIKHIELTVWAFNLSAKNFYQQLGYKILHHQMYKELP
jgi:GNAT superfamily N-acetyltransferase